MLLVLLVLSASSLHRPSLRQSLAPPHDLPPFRLSLFLFLKAATLIQAQDEQEESRCEEIAEGAGPTDAEDAEGNCATPGALLHQTCVPPLRELSSCGARAERLRLQDQEMRHAEEISAAKASAGPVVASTDNAMLS